MEENVRAVGKRSGKSVIVALKLDHCDKIGLSKSVLFDNGIS